jgi:hypothetical protein
MKGKRVLMFWLSVAIPIYSLSRSVFLLYMVFFAAVATTSGIKCGLVYDERCLMHKGPGDHPESPARASSIMKLMTSTVRSARPSLFTDFHTHHLSTPPTHPLFKSSVGLLIPHSKLMLDLFIFYLSTSLSLSPLIYHFFFSVRVWRHAACPSRPAWRPRTNYC